MKTRLKYSAFLLCACLKAGAQGVVVIADIETRVPVRNVTVRTNTSRQAVTDYTGTFYLAEDYQSATLTHMNYLSRTLTRKEMKDTVFLLPKTHTLSEVTIWGEERKNTKALVRSATRDAKDYAPPAGLSFDFFELFRKKPLNARLRKKNQELLERWDKER